VPRRLDGGDLARVAGQLVDRLAQELDVLEQPADAGTGDRAERVHHHAEGVQARGHTVDGVVPRIVVLGQRRDVADEAGAVGAFRTFGFGDKGVAHVGFLLRCGLS